MMQRKEARIATMILALLNQHKGSTTTGHLEHKNQFVYLLFLIVFIQNKRYSFHQNFLKDHNKSDQRKKNKRRSRKKEEENMP